MQMKRVAGKPRQGAGPADAAGSVLEVVGARRPNPAAEARRLPGGGFRVAPASSFPLPSASLEKHTYTTKTRRGDFPSLLCYFCTTMIGKTKRRRKSGCFTPCRPRRGCTGSWRPDHPTQPLEGQVLTKRCHSCQVYLSPSICFYLGCAFKPKVNSVRPSLRPCKGPRNRVTNLPWIQLCRFMVKKNQEPPVQAFLNLYKAGLSGVGVHSVLR